jgi:hypothetical protein
MKGKMTIKNGFIIGIILILIAIVVGLLTGSDIGFVFAGIGVMVIGFTILIYINKGDK